MMIMGTLVLEGGAEFGGLISGPDLRALELAGGMDSPVRILPTAAAPDQNHVRAGNNGIRWFRSLGARDVEVVHVIDPASAAGEQQVRSLRGARLVYLLGGFPRYLGETLRGSRAWSAILEAWEAGAVIAGSSAGAMVLCGHYYDPYDKQLLPGLDLLPDACILPHHNRAGWKWAAGIRTMLPGAVLIGIDEATGIINDGDSWSVHGAGQACLYLPGEDNGTKRSFSHGQTFTLGQPS